MHLRQIAPPAFLLIAAACAACIPGSQNVELASVSLTATPPTFVQGQSAQLTAHFAAGSGRVSPDVGAVTSDVPVTVQPAVTTTYTLSVSRGGRTVSNSATVTVTAPSSGQTLIYGDALAAGWEDWSWATHDLASVSPVSAGTRSISVDYTAHAAISFVLRTGASIAGGANLEFDVNGGTTANPAISATAQVDAVNGGLWGPEVAVAPYCAGGAIPSGAFAHCKVPLSVLQISGTTFQRIALKEAAGLTLPRMYFDEIAVVPAAAPPPPAIQSFTASPASITAGATATLAATFSDGTGSIDNGVGPISSGGTATVAPSVTTTYTLTVTGGQGSSVTRTATVTVSANPPPVVTITGSPTNPTAQTTASFSFTSSKAGSTFSCKLDSAPAAACASPQGYAGLAAGNHTFTVTATDPAGSASVPASFTWTISAAGGLVISSPLALDKTSVIAGDTLNGTVTYQNTSASPIVAQAIAITSRPPGGTHAGGPYDALAPSLSGQTIQPGATVTLAASRAFTGADPPGAWYAYATWQDAGATWHDGPNVNFTVAAPAPVISVAVSPSVASTTLGGTINFQATVTGTSAGQSTAVTWSVALGGGTIDPTTGVYVAPGVAGTYTVIATSVADPSKTGLATVNVGTPGSIIPLARRTTWNPGIPGGIPSRTTVCATINTATYGNGTTDATAAIQAAINGCPEGQVVYLPAGTYRVTSNLNIDKGIVLRGAGPALTKIRASLAAGSVAAIYMANLWPTYGSAVNVTADVPKDATSIPVANASGFAVGDIIQIDQLDDTSYVYDGNCPWFKRPDYGPPTTGHRSQGQVVEIASIVGNTLNLSTPIHLGFKLSFSPQVFKPTGPMPPAGSSEPPGITKYAGLESLYVTGGQNNQISMINCAYCWVANVESDGTTPAGSTASDGTAGPGNGMKGAHLLLDMSFRAVVRESYFHHATNVVQGGGAYGLSFSAHTSDSLVEDNIIYYMNKPLTMRATGGGNVVAYNYIDNAWTSADARLQETTLDMGHASFPYMELVEGNWAAQIATETVWGNSGWMTLFRNYASSQQQRTVALETYQIAAIALEAKSRYMNVVGNVLGAAGLGLLYEVHSNPPGPDQKTVYRLGHGINAGAGSDDIGTYENPALPGAAALQLYRHGNYDYVTGAVAWDATNSNHALPDSLYLSSKPAFFGATPWPWVDPVGTTKLYTLPAKARWDSGKPNP